MIQNVNQPETSRLVTLQITQAPVSRLVLSGIVGPLLWIVSALTSGLLRPGYSFFAQPISDLGIGTNAWILNVSLIGGGLLVIVFAIGFYQLLPNLRRRLLATTLLSIFGACFAIAGVFPESDPNGPMTIGGFIHFMAGFFFGMPVMTIALFVIGSELRKQPQWSGHGYYSIMSGLLVAALIPLTWVFFNPASPLEVLGVGGLMEWLLFLTWSAWFMVTGWRLFRHNRQK
jgi:hypothetical membrane protein